MRSHKHLKSSRKSQLTSNRDRTPSHPVVQPKSEKKAQMPQWQVNPDNWQVNFQNPLGGMYGHGMTPPVQAKLTIGEVGDKYEREADRVASEVVQKIHSPEPDTVQQQVDTTQDTFFKQGEYSPRNPESEQRSIRGLTRKTEQNDRVSLQRQEISISQNAMPDMIQCDSISDWTRGHKYNLFMNYAMQNECAANFEFFVCILAFNTEYARLSNPNTSSNLVNRAREIWNTYQNKNINVRGKHRKIATQKLSNARVDSDVENLFGTGTFDDDAYNGMTDVLYTMLQRRFEEFCQTEEYKGGQNTSSGRSRNLGVVSDREVNDRQITSLSDLSALIVRQNQN